MAHYAGRLAHATHDHLGPIQVVDDGPVRALHFGSTARQSAILRGAPEILLLDYTRAMMTALLFVPEPASVLLLGLGGGSLAAFLLHHFPACRVEAIELRPAVVEVARDWFDLPVDRRLIVTLDDAGAYLARAPLPAEPRHDLILLDAYDHAGMDDGVAALEALEGARERLAPGGVLVLNLWSAELGIYRHTTRLLRRLFDSRVLYLPVAGKGNVAVLALRDAPPRQTIKGLDERAQALEARYTLGLPGLLRTLRKNNPFRLFRL